MSLMGTLAKVALGVVAAKGVGALMNKSGGGAQSGGLLGGAGRGTQGGGIEGLMSAVLGGGGGAGGGIGGLLEQLGSGAAQRRSGGRSGGGLDDMLGGLLGGGAAGGIGGMLGGLMGGAQPAAPAQRGGSFGDLLNQSFDRMGEPETAPTPEQDAAAGLMLRAMIQAAKSDGRIDAAEKEKILSNLGDVSREEMDFVNRELTAPVDIDALVRDTPRGLAQQVYVMSVMGIDLDHEKEAQYLHALASGFGLGRQDVNAIHAELGVPALYA